MSTSIGFWLTDVQPKSRRTTPSEAYRRTTIVASRRTKRARENTSVGALVSRALGGRDMEGASGGFRKRRGAIATALIRAYPCTDVLCASGRPTRLPRRGSTLDRPQRPRARARDAALLPSAAIGLCRGGHLRAQRHRWGVLRQGAVGTLGRISRRARLLGGTPVGAQSATRASCRSDLAVEGRAGLRGRRLDRGEPGHHDRLARPYRVDARAVERRDVVCARRAALAHRVRRAGRRRRRDDRRGGAALRCRRTADRN